MSYSLDQRESDYDEMMPALSGTWDGYHRDELEQDWRPKTVIKQMPVTAKQGGEK